MNETPETEKSLFTRREFVQTSLTGLGGFVVAFYVPTSLRKAFAAEMPAAAAALNGPNAFIRIAPDDSITMVINKLEMGQGVNTSLAQLIAEELECDWTKIQSVSAPVAPAYNHTQFGMQMTGGSSALSSSWEQHRKIGATMREMLKAAAAKQWGVPVSEVKAENGAVTHRKHGALTYGKLAESAAQMPVPTDVKLKSSGDFKVIGQSKRRVDAADKANGKAQFGMDVRLPGMLYVMVARPPRVGAKLASVNDAKARAVKGVVDVVRVGDRVAVLAKNTHASRQGREALDVKASATRTRASWPPLRKKLRSQAF